MSRVGMNFSNMLEVLRERQIPFAVSGNNVLGLWTPEEYDAVYSDDVWGASDLTNQLIQVGHHDIWFIGDVELSWYAVALRITGKHDAGGARTEIQRDSFG